VLVLTPTRELAMQVSEATEMYGSNLDDLRVATVVGGMPYGAQLKALSRRVDVLVATPGRLLDHLQARRVDLSTVHTLVLDEADRMLDMGFIDDINTIVDRCPESRQTLLFSATLDGTVAKLAARMMRDPQRIEMTSQSDRHANITQTLLYADDAGHKLRLLDHLLRDVSMHQAIIFTATKRGADDLAEHLADSGFSAMALHGDMNQRQRSRTLSEVQDGRVRVLVATDVAARGIDVQAISHAINYDLPMQPEDYVHRIGRTGRAGRDGAAFTLAVHSERHKIRRIEHFIGNTIPPDVIAGLEPQRSPSARPEGASRGAMTAVVIASVAATTVTPLAAASPVLLPRVAMRLAVHRAETDPMRIVARNLSRLVVTNPPTHLVVTSLLVIASARLHHVVTSPLMHRAVIVAIVPKVHAATILSPVHAAKAVLSSTAAIAHPQIVRPMRVSLQHAQGVSLRLDQPRQAARLSPHAVMVLLAHQVRHVLAHLALRQAHVVALTLMVVAANPAISISADALAHSQRVRAFLHMQIQQAGGWLPFSAWMHHVLYAPGLGYYAAGNTKLADTQNPNMTALNGDFVTAPQLTPLFGYTLARQVAEVLRQTDTLDVLEFGAGSGALAHDLLTALNALGLSVRYSILEVSADLRQRQQARLATWGERITWLETLPNHFAGCVVGNELLDAMPVELFVWSEQGQVLERGVVSLKSNTVPTSDSMSLAQEFAFQDRPASPILIG
jgi:hypothetical protein